MMYIFSGLILLISLFFSNLLLFNIFLLMQFHSINTGSKVIIKFVVSAVNRNTCKKKKKIKILKHTHTHK